MRYADNYCSYVEKFDNDIHTYTFTGPCVFTGKQYSVTVLGSELHAYRRGAKLQDAFKNLSAGDREFLFSGFSPEGWDKAFPDDEEDEEDDINESPRFISTPSDAENVFKDMFDVTKSETKCPLCEAGSPISTMTIEHIRNGEVIETHVTHHNVASDGVDSVINVDFGKVCKTTTIDPTNPEA